MRDGDTYEVCCACGTEFLERTMHAVAACLFMCPRCFAIDLTRHGQVTEADDLPDDFADTELE